LSFAGKWMELENILLSKEPGLESQWSHVFSWVEQRMGKGENGFQIWKHTCNLYSKTTYRDKWRDEDFFYLIEALLFPLTEFWKQCSDLYKILGLKQFLKCLWGLWKESNKVSLLGSQHTFLQLEDEIRLVL
jgi:hypothetical protein